MKSWSIVYLLSGNEHINIGLLDREGEVHPIWVLWTSNLLRMQEQVFFEVRRDGQRFFNRVQKKIEIFVKGYPTLSQPKPLP